MPVPTIDNTSVNHKFETPFKTNEREISTPSTTDVSESLDTSSSDSISDSSESFDNEIGDLEQKISKVTITEHRRLELEGKLKPEPLLVENPGRFVLFPIQNHEVSNDHSDTHIDFSLLLLFT